MAAVYIFGHFKYFLLLHETDRECTPWLMAMEPVPEWNHHVTFYIIFTNISKRIRL